MVRYEALRTEPSCDRATAAASDADDHVALAAVDLLGSLKCDAATLTPLVSNGRSWRVRAHALVALAAVDPARAREGIAGMVADPTWRGACLRGEGRGDRARYRRARHARAR